LQSGFFKRQIVNIAVAVAGIVLVGAGVSLGWQTHLSHAVLSQAMAANDAADHLFLAVVHLGRERALGGIALGRDKPAADLEALQAARRDADRHWAEALAQAEAIASALAEPGALLRLIDEARRQAERHRALRKRLDEGTNPPPGMAWFDVITERVSAADRVREELLASSDVPAVTLRPLLEARRLAWRAVEHAGQVRGMVSYYTAADEPVPPDRLRQARAHRAEAEQQLRELLMRAGDWHLDAGLDDTQQRLEEGFLWELGNRGELLLEEAAAGRFPMGPKAWYELSTEFIDDAVVFARAVSERSLSRAAAQAARHRLQLFVYLAMVALSALLAAASLARVRRSANAAFLQRELAETTLRSIGDAVLTTDAEGRVRYLNPVAESLTGWSADQARARFASEVVPLRNRLRASMKDPVAACLANQRIVGLTSGHVLVRADGSEVPIEDSVAPIRNRGGEVVGTVMIFYNADRTDRDDHLLSYHASHDPLTGRLNRREFERRLEELVFRARRFEEEHALLYLDLDQFKIINDTAGHMAGDRILTQVAVLLDRQLRKSDTLARLGGDEFGVLLDNCDMAHARDRAEKLLEVLRDFRFTTDGRTFEIGGSIGLVPLQRDSPGPAALLSEADNACYLAKDKGRNRVEVAGADVTELKRRRDQMKWAANLPRIIESDGFELFVQPFRALGDDHPLRAEILLRMCADADDPNGELILPMAFIPAAERYGLIPRMDRWVITRAFGMLASHRPRNGAIMHINLSGASLDDEYLESFIRERAAADGIQPERICFEITETAAVAHLDRAIRMMKVLQADGFTFALDDVGTGLSSFSYVKLLPVQVMKIAGAFVRRLDGDPINQAMIECLSRLSRLVGLVTVAEEVESTSTMSFLSNAAIDYAQGFAIARPMPLARYLCEEGDGGITAQATPEPPSPPAAPQHRPL
jgi:diguanylate cyclase (GGDEF)-like protein/PAS domain S-box-containing protein